MGFLANALNVESIAGWACFSVMMSLCIYYFFKMINAKEEHVDVPVVNKPEIHQHLWITIKKNH